MHFPSQWIIPTIATLILGLEPLTLGARITNASSRMGSFPSENQTALSDQLPAASVIARKPRSSSNSGSSTAQVEQFLNVHRVGMAAVRGCVTEGFVRDCNRLVRSKSSLNNWCLQGKTEACSLFQTLSSQEAYQNTSDALLRSVQ